MIRKSWNTKSKEYDSDFDIIGDKIWNIWYHECQENQQYIMNVEAWKERFHTIPIIDNNSYWSGLIFKDEGAYLLFLLEWS